VGLFGDADGVSSRRLRGSNPNSPRHATSSSGQVMSATGQKEIPRAEAGMADVLIKQSAKLFRQRRLTLFYFSL